MTHRYNGILLNHKKNTFESVLMKWINLDPIKQSEVSQKEQNKCTLKNIYGIWKDGNDDIYSGQQGRCRHSEQTCGHSVEEEYGMNWESDIEKYMLPYVK